MAKYYGAIGFATQKEVSPGIWKDIIEERIYRGDIGIQSAYRYSNQQNSVNENLILTNMISIMADNYILNRIAMLRYVKWLGSYWKISRVENNRPRLIITMGEPYTGETANDN